MLLFEREIWTVDRIEQRETETAVIYLLKRVSTYTRIITGYSHSMTKRNALQIYALGERIQHCKNKLKRNTSRMDSS
jgi:hypothetical protein